MTAITCRSASCRTLFPDGKASVPEAALLSAPPASLRMGRQGLHPYCHSVISAWSMVPWEPLATELWRGALRDYSWSLAASPQRRCSLQPPLASFPELCSQRTMTAGHLCVSCTAVKEAQCITCILRSVLVIARYVFKHFKHMIIFFFSVAASVPFRGKFVAPDTDCTTLS